jgi:alkylation response protein AidB-like acyl-CoA dehydrogenase
MHHLFDLERTVATWRAHGGGSADVLAELLRSLERTLARTLPRAVSSRIDEEGSQLVRDAAGRLAVARHPALERARRELAELGLFRVCLPEDAGGFALPAAFYTLAVQLVSAYDASLALVLLVHGNAMYAIERYGTEEQRARYLPGLASGERVATVAFTEPRAGSDPGAIETRAVKDGEAWVLDGTKLFITNGGDADLLVTTARTGPLALGLDGVSTFILEREADGVEVLGLERKTALAGSPTAQLAYAGVRIPAARLLGELGRGGVVMLAGVGVTRVNIGAQALGIAKRAFDAAVEFALEREQGGARIVEHDAIRERLLDMALATSAMENLLCRVGRLEEAGAWHVRELSVAKLFCTEELQELTMRAINVHGGYGVCREHAVERCRREAVALPLYGGTSEIQWTIVARELLDAAAGRARADYRARDAALSSELSGRCAASPSLARAARTADEVSRRLWRAVEAVAAAPDPRPFYRPLAELASALAATEALLVHASSEGAGELERALALESGERLVDAAAAHLRRIEDGRTRGDAKAALRGVLGGDPGPASCR